MFLLKLIAIFVVPLLVCVIFATLQKNGLLPILVIATVTIIIAIALKNYLIKYLKNKKDLKEKETTPCGHGVPGAMFYTERCDICKEEKMKEAAIRLAKIEAERQRDYDKFLYNIKLPEYLKNMHPREFELLILDLYTRMDMKQRLHNTLLIMELMDLLKKMAEKVCYNANEFKDLSANPYYVTYLEPCMPQTQITHWL